VVTIYDTVVGPKLDSYVLAPVTSNSRSYWVESVSAPMPGALLVQIS